MDCPHDRQMPPAEAQINSDFEVYGVEIALEMIQDVSPGTSHAEAVCGSCSVMKITLLGFVAATIIARCRAQASSAVRFSLS